MIEQSRLSLSRITAYALPAVPLSALSLPLAVFIPPLYAEHTSLSLNLIGTLFFATRIIDVFTDPSFGLFADRTRPDIGRRKFWMLASVPLLMLSIWMLFNPPESAGWLYLTVWLSLIYLGYTMSFISHLAWGAELSGLYDDRSRVLGFRQIAVNGGMLTVLVLPAILSLDGDSVARATAMSIYVLISLPLTIGISVLLVPDPKPSEHIVEQPSLREILRDLSANPHLARLLIAEFCLASALGITGSLFVWFSEDVLRTGDQTSIVLLAYFGAAVISMPAWIWVAKRFEKHTAFSVAMLYGAATLGSYVFLPPENTTLAIIGTTLYGLAFGAGIFLARAMLADIADHDALTYGEPRMSIFFSTLTLMAKVGGAAGPFIAYNILGWVGYDPNVAPTETGTRWLMITFILAPSSFLLLGGWIIRKHTLTRAEHDKIRKVLEARSMASADESVASETAPAKG
ncbi:MAG: MFS transporter [Pseudomonadota bacterium]